MLKKIFFSFLTICLILVPMNVSAYEITGFDITANAAMLASMDTGEILYQKSADKKVYPASITKIMTVTLFLEDEQYDPNGKIEMTEEVLDMILGTGSAVSNLQAGETFTQLDLAYMTLMSSYGDCAYLGAIFYEGSVEAFVEKMNLKAAELGLSGTHYANPIGLHDEQNYTTVNDVRTLTLYALQNETFKKICETARYTMPATNKSGERTLSTTNFLQDTTTNYYYTYAKGVKTGFTDEAGRCLVSTASYNGYNYICILMGCPTNLGVRKEFVESRELYKWAFNNFSFKEIATSENPVCEMKVELSMERDFVPLYIEKGFVSVLPNQADDSTIIVEPHLDCESVDAPIKKGQKLGYADIIYAENVIGKVDLVAGDDVEANTVLVIARLLKNFFTSNYMKIVYLLLIAAVVIFIIMVVRLNSGRNKKRKVKYVPYNEEKERKNR